MKLYFQNKDDTICYELSYFKQLMKDENISELILYEAVRQEDTEGFFWCREYRAAGDKSKDDCGRLCKKYKPRNGKSGCCVHYSTVFYEASGKIKTLINHERRQHKSLHSCSLLGNERMY